MADLSETWKNSTVFKKQLELNLKELLGSRLMPLDARIRKYPSHWKDFISLVRGMSPQPNTILDVGCGCGAYYELCKKEFPDIKYHGIDYSQEAINIAVRQWECENFLVKDYKDLTSEYVSQFDLLHLGGILCILSNGDQALEFILSLSPKNVLIGRMDIIDGESFYDTYIAYNEISTYHYYHNRANFYALCKRYLYDIKNANDSYLLQKKVIGEI
jgi:trans-aconitate methyltransferase